MLGHLIAVRHGIDERVVIRAAHEGWLSRLLHALFRRH
jgi:hypothetical protein